MCKLPRRGGGAGREPLKCRRAGEATVDEPLWESGPEGWSDGRRETVGPDRPGGRGWARLAPQASQSWGGD